MVTGLIIISIMGLLGIIYTLLSINFAEVDEQGIEDEFSKKDFSKPIGWKVGKLPKEWQSNIIDENQEVNQKIIKESRKNDYSSLQMGNNLSQIKNNLINENKY